MKTVYYDKDNQFELNDEEYIKALRFWEKGKSVFIQRLKVNLSSFYKWAGEKPENKNMGRLHDGTIVVKTFGRWTLPDDEKITFDPNYYPEIYKDEVMSETEWQEKQKTKLLNK